MDAPFNYSDAIWRLCSHIVRRLPLFAAVEMERVGVSFNWTRVEGRFGVWASMTPLRFEGGLCEKKRSGILWRMPEVRISGFGQPLLYVLSIYVPRFFDLPLIEKMETVIHELYHISPKFNGDVRRFPGKHYAHGSKAKYDARVKELTRQWLSSDPPPELWNFLRFDSRQLEQRYPKVVGRRIAVPQPIRVEGP
ncbi:MAG: hypothetical protein IIZ25_09890 [Thermoguttaceae bacterium]|nr:hypothetical protein [Thermoguttaceae bacterium]